MTIEQMRALVGLPMDASDAEVVAAYAALIDDGAPASMPIVEPVTVEQARQQCGIEDEIADSLIQQKIRTAREWVEDYTSRIIAQRTLVAHFRTWGPYLQIFQRPIVSVDAIAFNGTAGDDTYTTAAYAIGPNPFRVYPGPGGWPSLRTGGGITVAYTAGYDEGEAPYCMIEAILVLVGGMIVEREGAYEQSVKAAERLLTRLTQVLV